MLMKFYSKFQLFIKVLPYIILSILIRELAGRFDLWLFQGFPDLLGILMTGVVLIIGFMLAGVFEDYKEAEQIPGSIAGSFLALRNHGLLVSHLSPEYNPKALNSELKIILQSVQEWLYERLEWKVLIRQIEKLSPALAQLCRSGGDAQVLEGERNNLLKSLTRIKTIKDTEFVAVGYSIMWTLSIAVMIMISLVKTEDRIFAYSCQIVYTFLIFMMIHLIKDMDDPFEYDGKGSADVDIAILEEAKQILSCDPK